MNKILSYCCGKKNAEFDDTLRPDYSLPEPEFYSLDSGPNPSTDESGRQHSRPLPIPPSLQGRSHSRGGESRTSRRLPQPSYEKYSVSLDVPYRHASQSIPPSESRRHGQRSKVPIRGTESPTKHGEYSWNTYVSPSRRRAGSRTGSPTKHGEYTLNRYGSQSRERRRGSRTRTTEEQRTSVGTYDIQIGFDGHDRRTAQRIERDASRRRSTSQARNTARRNERTFPKRQCSPGYQLEPAEDRYRPRVKYTRDAVAQNFTEHIGRYAAARQPRRESGHWNERAGSHRRDSLRRGSASPSKRGQLRSRESSENIGRQRRSSASKGRRRASQNRESENTSSGVDENVTLESLEKSMDESMQRMSRSLSKARGVMAEVREMGENDSDASELQPTNIYCTCRRTVEPRRKSYTIANELSSDDSRYDTRQMQLARRGTYHEQSESEEELSLDTKVDASILAARITLYKDTRKITSNEERKRQATLMIRELKAQLRIKMKGRMEISSDSFSEEETRREESRKFGSSYGRKMKKTGGDEAHLRQLPADLNFHDESKRWRRWALTFEESLSEFDSESVSEIESVRAKYSSKYSNILQLEDTDTESENCVGGISTAELERLKAEFRAQIKVYNEKESSKRNEQMKSSIERKIESRSSIEPLRNGPIYKSIGKKMEQPEESYRESGDLEAALHKLEAEMRAKARGQMSLDYSSDGSSEEAARRKPKHYEHTSGIDQAREIVKKAPVGKSMEKRIASLSEESDSDSEVLEGSFGGTALQRLKAKMRAQFKRYDMEREEGEKGRPKHEERPNERGIGIGPVTKEIASKKPIGSLHIKAQQTKNYRESEELVRSFGGVEHQRLEAKMRTKPQGHQALDYSSYRSSKEAARGTRGIDQAREIVQKTPVGKSMGERIVSLTEESNSDSEVLEGSFGGTALQRLKAKMRAQFKRYDMEREERENGRPKQEERPSEKGSGIGPVTKEIVNKKPIGSLQIKAQQTKNYRESKELEGSFGVAELQRVKAEMRAKAQRHMEMEDSRNGREEAEKGRSNYEEHSIKRSSEVGSEISRNKPAVKSMEKTMERSEESESDSEEDDSQEDNTPIRLSVWKMQRTRARMENTQRELQNRTVSSKPVETFATKTIEDEIEKKISRNKLIVKSMAKTEPEPPSEKSENESDSEPLKEIVGKKPTQETQKNIRALPSNKRIEDPVSKKTPEPQREEIEGEPWKDMICKKLAGKVVGQTQNKSGPGQITGNKPIEKSVAKKKPEPQIESDSETYNEPRKASGKVVGQTQKKSDAGQITSKKPIEKTVTKKKPEPQTESKIETNNEPKIAIGKTLGQAQKKSSTGKITSKKPIEKSVTKKKAEPQSEERESESESETIIATGKVVGQTQKKSGAGQITSQKNIKKSVTKTKMEPQSESESETDTEPRLTAGKTVGQTQKKTGAGQITSKKPIEKSVTKMKMEPQSEESESESESETIIATGKVVGQTQKKSGAGQITSKKPIEKSVTKTKMEPQSESVSETDSEPRLAAGKAVGQTQKKTGTGQITSKKPIEKSVTKMKMKPQSEKSESESDSESKMFTGKAVGQSQKKTDAGQILSKKPFEKRLHREDFDSSCKLSKTPVSVAKRKSERDYSSDSDESSIETQTNSMDIIKKSPRQQQNKDAKISEDRTKTPVSVAKRKSESDYSSDSAETSIETQTNSMDIVKKSPRQQQTKNAKVSEDRTKTPVSVAKRKSERDYSSDSEESSIETQTNSMDIVKKSPRQQQTKDAKVSEDHANEAKKESTGDDSSSSGTEDSKGSIEEQLGSGESLQTKKRKKRRRRKKRKKKGGKENEMESVESKDAKKVAENYQDMPEKELPTKSQNKKRFSFKQLKNTFKRRSSSFGKRRPKSEDDEGQNEEVAGPSRSRSRQDAKDEDQKVEKEIDPLKKKKSKTPTERENDSDASESDSEEAVDGTKKKKGFKHKLKNIKERFNSRSRSQERTDSTEEESDEASSENDKKQERERKKDTKSEAQEVEEEEEDSDASPPRRDFTMFLAGAVSKAFAKRDAEDEEDDDEEEETTASGTKKKKGLKHKFKNIKERFNSRSRSRKETDSSKEDVDSDDENEERGRKKKNKSKKEEEDVESSASDSEEVVDGTKKKKGLKHKFKNIKERFNSRSRSRKETDSSKEERDSDDENEERGRKKKNKSEKEEEDVESSASDSEEVVDGTKKKKGLKHKFKNIKERFNSRSRSRKKTDSSKEERDSDDENEERGRKKKNKSEKEEEEVESSASDSEEDVDGTNKKKKGFKHKFKNIKERFNSRSRSVKETDSSEEDVDEADSENEEKEERERKKKSKKKEKAQEKKEKAQEKKEKAQEKKEKAREKAEEKKEKAQEKKEKAKEKAQEKKEKAREKKERAQEKAEEKKENAQEKAEEKKEKAEEKTEEKKEREQEKEKGEEEKSEKEKEKPQQKTNTQSPRTDYSMFLAVPVTKTIEKRDEEENNETIKKEKKKEKKKNSREIGENEVVDFELSETDEADDGTGKKGLKQKLKDIKRSISTPRSPKGSINVAKTPPKPESSGFGEDKIVIPDVKRKSRFRRRFKFGRDPNDSPQDKRARKLMKLEKKNAKKAEKEKKKEERRQVREELDQLYGPKKKRSFFSWKKKSKKKRPEATEVATPKPKPATPHNTDWDSSSTNSIMSESSWLKKLREHNRQLIAEDPELKDKGSSRHWVKDKPVISEYSKDPEQGPSIPQEATAPLAEKKPEVLTEEQSIFNQMMQQQSPDIFNLMKMLSNSGGLTIDSDSPVRVSPQLQRILSVQPPVPEASSPQPTEPQVLAQSSSPRAAASVVRTATSFTYPAASTAVLASTSPIPADTSAAPVATSVVPVARAPDARRAATVVAPVSRAPFGRQAATPAARQATTFATPRAPFPVSRPGPFDPAVDSSYYPATQAAFDDDLDEAFGAQGTSAFKPWSPRTPGARTSTSPCFDPPWTPTPPGSPELKKEKTAKQKEAEELDALYYELIAELDEIEEFTNIKQ